jgi:hypothetical protein
LQLGDSQREHREFTEGDLNMTDIDNIIKGILNREGGFTNKPADKGGPTKYGITQKTLTAWRQKPATIQDVKDLTLDEAFQIYKKLYVEDPGFLKLGDDALAEQLIDAGANHGTKQSIRLHIKPGCFPKWLAAQASLHTRVFSRRHRHTGLQSKNAICGLLNNMCSPQAG